MKTLLLMFVVFLSIVLAGCNEEVCQFTGWGIGGSDANADRVVTGRVGVRNNDGYEFGGESIWFAVEDEKEIQNFGAYFIAEWPGDPNSGIVPYAGFHGALGDAKDGSLYGPIAGTLVKIGKNVDSVLEYQYLDFQQRQAEINDEQNDEHRVLAGIRARF